MQQREFDAVGRPEATGFSGGQLRFAVETLGDTRRNASRGEEPVEDQRPLCPSGKPARNGLSVLLA